MNITKYGIADYCGYGVFYYGYYSKCTGFYTYISIVARSEITTETRQDLQWIPSVLQGLKLGATSRNPIYVVFDSDTGTWKEYFSGMTVNLAKTHSLKDSLGSIGSFNADVRRDFCDILSVSTPRECNATEFAEGVSKYSDEQIKEIVAQLNTLRSSASEWKSKFDAMVKAVKDERAAKEAGLSSLESKLASGVGKYGNESSVEPEKKDDSGCYLTTACMRALSQSFNDDCHELGTLRAFRDAYVKERHPEAVEEYYRVAPKIVAAISQREYSQSIYQKIYEELVLGTLRLIERNLCEEAYTLYRDYSLVLNRTYSDYHYINNK